MGFEYVGMWVFHNTAITQTEGGKSDSNLTHPILKMGCLGIYGGIGLNASI
jgi:hypothetical protein